MLKFGLTIRELTVEVMDAFASEMVFYTNIIAGLGIIGWIIAMWYFSRHK